MPFAPADRLGPYEIISPLGKGGMGEVWKARDSRLGRDVAIKISAQQFSDRFEREARAIAALNHSSICTLYDVGPNYLVMELIEGPTLADRIAEGTIPLEEALSIAKQIADALEAAHEKGIVHRDLKPANVKIRPDRSVKVLDFGLAKSGEESGTTSDSPTMLSVAGMILGTAGYMAPEQARGKAVDKRADIWAFGVVLYEMVTGERLFDGETVSDTLAAVLTREPDVTKAPFKVQRLLRACLEKDSRLRLRDVGDFGRLLDEGSWIGNPAPVTNLRDASGKVGWIAAVGVLAAVAGGLGYMAWHGGAEQLSQVIRFSIPSPENGAINGISGLPVAISPDGKRVIFTAQTEGKRTLWVRDLDSLSARPLAGTESGRDPFWSPDSRSVGFVDPPARKLKRVDVSGDAVQTVCDLPNGNTRGGTWTQTGRDVILFAINDAGIFQVPATGGVPAPVIKPDVSRSEDDVWPSFLPDGHHFLYTARTGLASGLVYVADLESGARKSMVPTPLNAMFANGELLFVRGGTLLAQPFDSTGLKTTGEALPLVSDIGANQVTGVGFFSASRTGILGTFPNDAGLQLTWFNRAGAQEGTIGPVSKVLEWATISPDGSTIATAMGDFSGGSADVWLYNPARGTTSRFTFGPSENFYPLWSPDGKRIAFASLRDGVEHGFQKALAGGNEDSLGPPAGNPPHFTLPEDWSPDGHYVVERLVVAAATKDDLWVQPLGDDWKPGERKPLPYLQSQFNERNASFSPDGKWLAYASDETGRYEIYTQTFPTAGGKVQISNSGGDRPRWSRDGKEIFYIAPDRKMMAAPVRVAAALDVGKPVALFDSHIGASFNNRFDVTKDGRFLIPVAVDQANSQGLNVVVNWPAALKK